MRTFFLQKSDKPEKKWMIYDYENPDKVIHFGQKGYQSYPDHKNPMRKKLYKARHRKNENWTKSGIDTSGFWSVHLLWNKPSLADSIKDTEDRFDIKIIT